MQPSGGRIHGLDTLRASAIVFVYLVHYEGVIKHHIFNIGWIGVDLFFVLSGYLVSHQLFTDIAHKRNFSGKTFIIRRLIRTLPNYLVVLALYVFIDGFREKAYLPPIWKFLTFTVNMGLAPGAAGVAFSNSWSLCVEEQFYLVLPLVVLYVYYKKSLKFALNLMVLILISGMVLRAISWFYCAHGEIYFNTPIKSNKFDFINWNMLVYYNTFCRLDALIFGVFIAWVRDFYGHIWHRITLRGNYIFAAGLTLLIITCLFLNGGGRFALIQTVLGYTLLGISFGLLVISALSPTSILHKTKIFGAEQIARWSFAIYLVQKPIDHLTSSILIHYHIMDREDLHMFLCTATASVLGGWLLHKLVEIPFLKLRDYYYKRPAL